MSRITRQRTTEHRLVVGSLASSILGNSDIFRLVLPALPFGAFVSLRRCSSCIYQATQEVCEELVAVLERAAALYVSPRYVEALQLVSDHQPHFAWLIQTPALAVVTYDRYEDVVTGAYHLLQAHLTRMQKLAVSLVLRRAASRRHSTPLRRCMLLHMGVRLGMFTESPRQLAELHSAAEDAVKGIAQHFGAQQPPATAAAHYTLAGFYTYHHRRQELGEALPKAQRHLEQALAIQCRQLGRLHIATLCSQLVKSQVLLMLDDAPGCGRLLQRQLGYCRRALGDDHPLAAKMLAVMARLELKLGHEDKCDELQKRVLHMRREALGLTHEDTHRSAMDVYSRRRQVVIRNPSDAEALHAMAEAMRTCLDMLRRAALEQSGTRGFCLSKSLQAMADTAFIDLVSLAKRRFLSNAMTMQLLEAGAWLAERLPASPFEYEHADLEAWEQALGPASALPASALAGHLFPPPPVAPPLAAPAGATAGTSGSSGGGGGGGGDGGGGGGDGDGGGGAPLATGCRHDIAAKLRQWRDRIAEESQDSAGQ